MKTENSIESILTDKKIPVTAMRLLVLKEFLKSGSAISLSELEENLEATDRSTLYRTLKTFEKKGLVHTVQENNATQYLLCHDGCSEAQHHDAHLHFYCTHCKKTTCLEEVHFENLKFPAGYQIENMKFVATGICPSCRSLQ